jgi:HEAT repeat protein
MDKNARVDAEWRRFLGVGAGAALSGQVGSEEARTALIEAFRNSNDSRVRRGCAIAMGYFKDEAAIDFLREALDKDESYFVGVAAIRALSHIGGDRAYDILSAALARKSWQEVVRSAVFHGFAAAKERRAVEQAIAHSRFGEHPALRNAAIACLGSLGKELRKDKKEEKVVDHLIEFATIRLCDHAGWLLVHWAKSVIRELLHLFRRLSDANASMACGAPSRMR